MTALFSHAFETGVTWQKFLKPHSSRSSLSIMRI